MAGLQPIPDVTSFAAARLLVPESDPRPIRLTDDGHLLISIRGDVMTRTDALLLCSEGLEIRPVNLRMQGRAVPDLFRRLVSATGDGYLVLGREREDFHPMRLEKDLCFFVEPYVWAFDSALMWDVGMLPGSRTVEPISLVRLTGEGTLAIRVPGQLIAVKVAHGRPHRVRRDAFVGWVGNVVPALEPDVPFIYCEGEGAVFVSLPRAMATEGSA